MCITPKKAAKLKDREQVDDEQKAHLLSINNNVLHINKVDLIISLATSAKNGPFLRSSISSLEGVGPKI